jgi:hypothetical protein
VSARRGDLQGTLGYRLPGNVAEVAHRGGSRPGWPRRLVGRPELAIAAQEAQHISQAARSEDPQVSGGLSLAQVGLGHDQPLETLHAAEAKRDRE